jgi:hypothetical protein
MCLCFQMVAAEGEAARLASPSHHAADMSQDLGEGGRHHPVGTLTHVLKRKLSGATLPASKQRQGGSAATYILLPSAQVPQLRFACKAEVIQQFLV